MFLPKNDDSKKIFEIIKKVKDIDLEWAIKELQYIEEHEPSISSDILKIYNQCQKKKTIGPKNTFNSYILYALNCTSVRPESFINVPDRRIYARVGFPDIDMDFDHERFNEVEQYAIKKYGEDYFGKIGTHQHISVKLAIRRAIKVLDPGNFSNFDKDGKLLKDGSSESYQLEQLILKTLPEINGQLKKPDGLVCQSVKEAYELFPEFRRYMDQYPEVYRIACRLNGNLNAFGCLSSDTLILTDTGYIKISELDDSVKIGYIDEDNNIRYTSDFISHKTGNKLTYELRLENNTFIDVTDEHLIFTDKGIVLFEEIRKNPDSYKILSIK